jgi:type IV pilus assembly protein PilV
MPNNAAARPAAAARPQRGSTLVEVLVTVVILAFSLLGLAGLLNQTTSMAQESHRRTVVTQNIYALADRMRVAIAAGVNANDYNSLSTPSPAACSTTATAQVDFCEWTQTLKTSLGTDATGKINRVGSTNLFTIEVDWKDPKVVDIHDVPITQTYSLTVRP